MLPNSKYNHITFAALYALDERIPSRRSCLPRCEMISPPARRAQYTHTGSFAAHFGFPHLPDLEEMSIRVMEEGPGLVAPLEGWGEKLGSARAEDLVGNRAVRNPNAQFADHARAGQRWRIDHGRRVFHGTTLGRQENLAPGKAQKAQGPGKLTYHCRSQYIAIECQRASVVADHKEASEFHPIRREA